MYRTQHNDRREGDREVGRRWRGEREGDKDKEGVEVKIRKEEEGRELKKKER